MGGMSGLELQRALEDREFDLPIVFVTGHGDVSAAVTAFRNGALHFLEKPFDNDELLGVVRTAVEQSKTQSDHCEFRRQLTEREKEVWELLLLGNSNKELARKLDISVRTAEFHRANVLKKAQVLTIAELIEKTK